MSSDNRAALREEFFNGRNIQKLHPVRSWCYLRLTEIWFFSFQTPPLNSQLVVFEIVTSEAKNLKNLNLHLFTVHCCFPGLTMNSGTSLNKHSMLLQKNLFDLPWRRFKILSYLPKFPADWILFSILNRTIAWFRYLMHLLTFSDFQSQPSDELWSWLRQAETLLADLTRHAKYHLRISTSAYNAPSQT